MPRTHTHTTLLSPFRTTPLSRLICPPICLADRHSQPCLRNQSARGNPPKTIPLPSLSERAFSLKKTPGKSQPTSVLISTPTRTLVVRQECLKKLIHHVVQSILAFIALRSRSPINESKSSNNSRRKNNSSRSKPVALEGGSQQGN